MVIQRMDRQRNVMTYRATGVDIVAADGWLATMRPLIRTTHRPGVLPDRGQFAGLFDLRAAKLRDPILVSSTDGVGTKLKLAQRAHEHRAIGIDLVAMNVNDVLTYGAHPLFFLDYVAVGKIQPSVMTAVVAGVVAGCRESGCALLGGETAEMPGVYQRGEYDVAGFCVGAVERSRLIDGRQVAKGDAIIGLTSSGVHANGFSLVRKVLSRAQLHRLRRQLLEPTRIYVKPVLNVLRRLPIHAMAHVTGGGIARRIPSLVQAAPSLRAQWWPGRWSVPNLFGEIQQAGALTMKEMTATFNMGIGMALVCRRRDVTQAMRILQQAGVPAWEIGAIE